jgi:hypothetical protein
MTDAMISLNIDLSSWDTLCICIMYYWKKYKYFLNVKHENDMKVLLYGAMTSLKVRITLCYLQ